MWLTCSTQALSQASGCQGSLSNLKTEICIPVEISRTFSRTRNEGVDLAGCPVPGEAEWRSVRGTA